MGQVLHFWMEAFVEIFLWRVETHQDTDIHLISQELGAETLEVLADSGVGLSLLIGLMQNLCIQSIECFIWEEYGSLINVANDGKDFSKAEALDGHCIQVTPCLGRKL